MAKTYIAFLECTFHDDPPFWMEGREFDDPESNEEHSDPRECYISKDNGAKFSLVDLRGARRDYTFKKSGVVKIMGNVVMILDWQLEQSPVDDYQ